jgi:hypothetical protein
MHTNLVSRHFRILRVFLTFGAIGFVQFLGLSAAADPASRMAPETWTETRSKAQGAQESKLAKEARPELLRRQRIKLFRLR